MVNAKQKKKGSAIHRAMIPGAYKWQITADSSRPETISHVKRLGFNIVSAMKGKNSVEEGTSFLKSYDICVHPRCRHTIEELTHYTWKVDRLTGAILPQLANANNHVIDALRYALEGVRRAGSGRVEFASAGRRTSLSAPGGVNGEIMPGLQSHVSPSAGWGSVPGPMSGGTPGWLPR